MIASIQKILDVLPVENADALDRVKVLGWQVVAKRGEFKVGDLACYVEIDSVLPDKPEFSFLAKMNFRVKTIRLRQCLSQGIVFDLSILPTCDWQEGQDVSEILGVVHYEKHIPGHIGGLIERNFPSFIPKTDEERMQNIPKVVDELYGKPYIITTKVDGTSCTIFHNNGEFGVCSRRNQMKEDDRSVYWRIVKKYDLENRLSGFEMNIALQGEIVGPGIQKNRLNLKEPDFLLFDVYDIDKGRYMNATECSEVRFSLGLRAVPTVELGQAFPYNAEQLLELAKGKYEGTENDQEGIVVRSFYGEYSERLHGRISFKVLNNDFLLKND